MELIPTNLSVDEDALIIGWSDGTDQSIKIRELRDRCPCANCRDQRTQQIADATPKSTLNILTPEEARPLSIVKMEPAGNYAYTIHFSDGHNNGLFTFEFLQSFGS